MTPLNATKAWLETCVIDLGLCPFASKVFYENQILFVTLDFTDLASLRKTFDDSIHSILNDDSPYTTALLIISSGLDRFEDYLDVYYTLEEKLIDNQKNEFIQLASFHPHYQFEGTDISDLENYTNRSPYPTIHLLRTDLVEEAIESHPDIHAVPVNNIEHMNRLGIEKLKQLFNS